ncbi:RNase III inhibitor [Citrobacter braakii]|nr:RNase III inhibitor [Citrobacter braakii]
MKLILSAPVPAMAEAFKRAFEGVENVEVIAAPFETIKEFDCMVSAANSFGLMDGGVDAAITAFFGDQLQSRVQRHIVSYWGGEQPVGTAFVINSGKADHPWLVHAPTMRTPSIIAGTDSVYAATWAGLLAIETHNLEHIPSARINSVVFPAMGAGCGQVPFDSVAAQMKLAWLNFNNPPVAIDWDYALSRTDSVVRAIHGQPEDHKMKH